jgi:hypothetical protein
MTTMLLYQWIFVALAVLTVLVTLRLRRRPPSLPPLASLQGIPAELRNQVYELVAIEPSTRFISGEKLVASYQTLHNQRSPKFERTSLKWYVSEMPMANIKVPIIDAAPILPSATARHALSNASQQLRAEFRHFEQQVSASEYLFVLDNFDLKQMELIAGSIRALDNEAHRKDPSSAIDYHICFATDKHAVRSAQKLCSFVEEMQKLPPGLEYIAHRMTKVQVKTGLTPSQADRIYGMFADVRRRTQGGKAQLQPISFLQDLFHWKVQLHRPRSLKKYGRCT